MPHGPRRLCGCAPGRHGSAWTTWVATGLGGGAEADELVDLYQEVATHLSVIRSTAPDPAVVTYLSSLLARARTRATGTRTTGWSGVADFFVRRFPAALYRTRRWWWPR